MRATNEIARNLGCAYIYDDWGRINLKADKVAEGEKVIIETLPTNGTLDFTFTPIVKEERTAIFAFLRHCELDFEGEEVGSIIDEMLELCKRFVAELNASQRYEFIGVQEWGVVLDFLDANMAGVRATITLKEIGGRCLNE